MRILGIIPARYSSSRFPGKPLVDIMGKTMIQRVYEQALQAEQLDSLVVATDDKRIFQHVEDLGYQAIITADEHQSGTDRCAEVLSKMSGFDVVINIQGDEPFIDPTQIDLVCQCFVNTETELATLIKPISTIDELLNPNLPKVVINKFQDAIYFSRTAIPYCRGKEPSDWLQEHTYYKHIGLYGYRKDALLAITQLPVSALEETEALEQLRWIESGYRIQTAITHIETQAVDTPEDLEKILKIYANP